MGHTIGGVYYGTEEERAQMEGNGTQFVDIETMERFAALFELQQWWAMRSEIIPLCHGLAFFVDVKLAEPAESVSYMHPKLLNVLRESMGQELVPEYQPSMGRFDELSEEQFRLATSEGQLMFRPPTPHRIITASTPPGPPGEFQRLVEEALVVGVDHGTTPSTSEVSFVRTDDDGNIVEIRRIDP